MSAKPSTKTSTTSEPITEPAEQPGQPAPALHTVPSLADAFTADEDAPLVVEPTTEDRLAQLHAAYPEAKAAADAAAKHLKTITDGIKQELGAVVPDGTERIELRGHGQPLRLSYVKSWRLDSTRFKKEDPETYVRYAKQSGAWVLKAVGGAE